MPGGRTQTFGIQLTFATSGWTPEVVDASRAGFTRDVVEKTHHGSTEPDGTVNQYGGRVYEPSVIGDPGTLELTVQYDSADPPPLHGDPETITLAFRLVDGDAVKESISGSGFIISMSEPLPISATMRQADITIKKSGVWTRTPPS